MGELLGGLIELVANAMLSPWWRAAFGLVLGLLTGGIAMWFCWPGLLAKVLLVAFALLGMVLGLWWHSRRPDGAD